MAWYLALPVGLLLLVLAVLLALWVVGERGHLLLPSTRAVMEQGRRPLPPAVRPDGSLASHSPGVGVGGWRKGLLALHGYVYGRWPDRYIGFALRLLPRASPSRKARWADHYHGKVLPPQLARRIIALDHDIPRTDLEQIIPYPTAREILLEASPKITVMDCPCRMNRKDPCLPLGVCMLVGGGDFVLEHRPEHSRRISQEEALSILEAEHERGHVHTAYFKDAVGDRFYAICNCCPCCCAGMEAMMEHGVPMVASSGYVARVDGELCIACGECVNACPFGAVQLEEGQAVVRWGECMGCGVCESRCTTGAMDLVLDPEKGVPLDVRVLGRTESSALEA